MVVRPISRYTTKYLFSDFIGFSFTVLFDPHCGKTGLRGFRPGPTQTGLYSTEDG